MLASRALNKEKSYYAPNSESDWLEWGGQNDKEGRSGCFFVQNNTWPNKNPAPGKQHECNDSISERGDGPYLPHGLSVVNTYTKVISGSKQVVVVMKNLMATPITITKGIKATQVMVANMVPPVELASRTLEELDEVQGIQWTRISVERRKEVLLQQLDLSGLDGWTEANQVATHALLADYHDIFSLDPGELGCTNLAKHEIRIVDDEPLKEQFWSIPAPLVDEVWAHVKEMLEVGTICQRQSPWCNAVVLVNKKEGGLHFCIDFCNLNARTKKDSYLLPGIQEAIESLVGAGYFCCLDLKVVFGK